jgi:hypothetical protein
MVLAVEQLSVPAFEGSFEEKRKKIVIARACRPTLPIIWHLAALDWYLKKK